jgi:hypothetical protein
MNLRRFF